MSARPWMPMYHGDYLRDTRSLSLIQHGAYHLLLCTYYSTAQPLEADKSSLYRVCAAMTEDERQAVDFVIGKFFTLDGDVYRNKRADEEIAKAEEIQAKRSEAGKRGANARANASANASTSDDAIADTTTTTSTTTTTNNKKPKKGGRASALPDWVPREEWDGFVEYRKKSKAPLTDRAIKLCINDLDKLRKEGHNPASVLNQSVMRGWKGLFGINGKDGTKEPESRPEHRAFPA